MGILTPHWAENLQIGNKCLATIRHKTDGSKNLHNVEVIVIENNCIDKEIVGWFRIGSTKFSK